MAGSSCFQWICRSLFYFPSFKFLELRVIISKFISQIFCVSRNFLIKEQLFLDIYKLLSTQLGKQNRFGIKLLWIQQWVTFILDIEKYCTYYLLKFLYRFKRMVSKWATILSLKAKIEYCFILTIESNSYLDNQSPVMIKWNWKKVINESQRTKEKILPNICSVIKTDM